MYYFFRYAFLIPEVWSLWILFPNTETLCLVAAVNKDMHNTQAIKTAYSVPRKHYSQLEIHMCYVYLYTSIICNSNITLVFGLRQTVSVTVLCVHTARAAWQPFLCTQYWTLKLIYESFLQSFCLSVLSVWYETVTDFLVMKQIHSMTDRKTRCTRSFSNDGIKQLNTDVNTSLKNKIH